MKRVLEMNFKRTDDKIAKLSVINAREDLTGEEVKTAMENILGANIFLIGGAELAEIHEAKIIRTEEEVLELE
ncbi:MAG: DUF2922 domain-containing protein [Clostridiales bacterium]|mgnify:CR=1 FL=1|nr:DUF2922 domain-containing protein [Clostridiales bacterium]